MRAMLGLAAAAAAFVTLVSSATALAGGDDGDGGNPVVGRAIFLRDNCSGCHGTFGGGGMGPNLRADPPDDDDVRDAVLNGRPTGMPSFRHLMSDAEVQDLAAYLDTLGSNGEPRGTHWWEVVPSRFPGQVRCCAPPSEPPHTTP